MADSMQPVIRSTDNVIYDNDGTEILRITASEMTIQMPDGTLEHRKKHENLILADGTSWNAAMLYAQPPVQIGACAQCRKPPYSFPFRAKPSHGLVRLTRAKTCPDCGTLTCPKHRTRCSDGRFRCTVCARKWRLRESILGLFFVTERP
ncbi:MAG: hypothetical protein D8M59_03695 [Planctomycetes bacterium]|nr:hypothetical protein [Planctomycetota bacterium]NOG53100.1 hypothetical protein [Planctomycetota bacterium]